LGIYLCDFVDKCYGGWFLGICVLFVLRNGFMKLNIRFMGGGFEEMV